ncbi:MAG TPA: IPT/TIG domain-containing protein, partial [Elusimicrobiales bacterium]|nr:IPT/TIG domain-containing protein [Elusimicrobiales bacterium]
MSFTVLAVDAASMTPVAGPIGIPFTIYGAGFGNYSAGWTRVLIGGTTAPLTLWSDTQIKGTVPGILAAGPHEVIVERELNGGLIRSSALNFDVVTPAAQLISPSSGPIGLPFVIDGSSFGNYVANYTRVLIGGTTCPLTLWTDSQIKGTVPGTIASGAHEVVVERQLNGGLVASQPLPFTLTVPDLASVAPSSGPIGLPFTLTGSGFGNYVANYTRVLIGGTTAPLTLWTDTQIKGTVPGTIAPGAHEVVVERQLNGGLAASQPLGFELADPVLESIAPSPVSVLAPFTLTGYNFGNYAAGKAEALIGGATAQLTLWTDTQIKGKLPALGEGDYPVLVRRTFNGGVSQSQASTMTVVEPSVSSMTPVSGQPGGSFSVFGVFFGPYDAAIARVLIGGLPGPLSLWTDGRINGTIPAELGVGMHTVIVSRGQYQADPLEFYVPEGGGYSPSSFISPLSPSAAFRLGSVYVYPNPAKGGAVPVFHLEFGLADKLELKVYNVAGTLVHERVLTGFPQVMNNVYAYEYAWEGHIASGVYYFTVEAARAGAKLKARGKFAVVR